MRSSVFEGRHSTLKFGNKLEKNIICIYRPAILLNESAEMRTAVDLGTCNKISNCIGFNSYEYMNVFIRTL